VTVYLSLEQVLAVHEALRLLMPQVRDMGAVQSAVERPRTTVFGEDAYPTVWEKAAALMQSLARNHGFIDGNKRTAWVAAMAFLEVNGHPLDPDFDVDAAEELVLSIAEGRTDEVRAIAAELPKYTSS
jgi:death-on-curing protein